jgi:K+-sensing histidine kinase KdpD
LRTPLSLDTRSVAEDQKRKHYRTTGQKIQQLVFNNASMLMNLVNQLLDFRKVETGGFSLDAA